MSLFYLVGAFVQNVCDLHLVGGTYSGFIILLWKFELVLTSQPGMSDLEPLG